MPHPVLETEECIGCGICVESCEQGVLDIVDGVVEVVDDEACIGCSDCVEACPMGCIPEVAED